MKAIQVYKEVGYPYLLMPDHVPQAPRRSRRAAVFRLLLRLHSRADSGSGPVDYVGQAVGSERLASFGAIRRRMVSAGLRISTATRFR